MIRIGSGVQTTEAEDMRKDEGTEEIMTTDTMEEEQEKIGDMVSKW